MPPCMQAECTSWPCMSLSGRLGTSNFSRTNYTSHILGKDPRKRRNMTTYTFALQLSIAECAGQKNRATERYMRKVTCRRRIPRVAEPNLVASSPRSLISCSTNAELDSAKAAPITTASSTLPTAASCGDAWKICNSIDRLTQISLFTITLLNCWNGVLEARHAYREIPYT